MKAIRPNAKKETILSNINELRFDIGQINYSIRWHEKEINRLKRKQVKQLRKLFELTELIKKRNL